MLVHSFYFHVGLPLIQPSSQIKPDKPDKMTHLAHVLKQLVRKAHKSG